MMQQSLDRARILPAWGWLTKPWTAFVASAVLLLAVSGTWAATAFLGDDRSFLSTASDKEAVPGLAPAPRDDSATTSGAFTTDAIEEAFRDSSSQFGLAASDGGATGDSLLTGRSIVSNAAVAIEVPAVRPAMTSIRAIAESLGGFVEELSASGGAEPSNGNATVRVPGPAFFDAVERMEALGEVLSEVVGTEDVSEEIIDLSARLRSEQTKEASFLTLLDRAESVSDVLSIERELSRVRADIERLEGQLGYIERRVELATIRVSLNAPELAVLVPPSASMHIDVDDVDDALETMKQIISRAGGTIDVSSTSLRNEGPQAFLAFRVHSAGFSSVLTELDELGTFTAREVRESVGAPSPDSSLDPEPDSTIDVTLRTTPDSGTSMWMIIGIIAASIGAALLLVGLLFAAYRVGGRRAGARSA